MLRRSTAVLALALAALGALVSPAAAKPTKLYPDADFSEAFFRSPSSAGTATLHADVLRPKGSTRRDKTPVILSIGPYFNHSGQVGLAGPIEGTSYDPTGLDGSSLPSERFQDFVEGSDLLKKGYTFVMVDLRGFGGSNGCLDWAGPGEQADVVNAVRWAASRPWSTGKVGMYGKSYDALTGLIGANHQPKGLGAVVSQEPVYDDYRYLYGDGMRRENSIATPLLYDAIAATPGPATDTPGYNSGGLTDPLCLGLNVVDQAANDDPRSDYWKQRNLIPGARGSDVPLFLTQGLAENNTVADGMTEYLRNHSGPERGWLGPWEHVRGNERTENGRLKMGRKGWFGEVMRFYDRFLKGKRSAKADPGFAVQTNDGVWRSEKRWPPADSRGYTTKLSGGEYRDTALSVATGSGGGEDPTTQSGAWTVSEPLRGPAHLAGSPKLDVRVTTTIPRANLVVDVYDLHRGADGEWTGPLVTRQGHLVREAGASALRLSLWAADWKFRRGHRLAVRVTDNNQDWWAGAIPTAQTVDVRGGRIELPFLGHRRTESIQGRPGVQLRGYKRQVATAPADAVAVAKRFSLPKRTPAARSGEFSGGYAEPVGG